MCWSTSVAGKLRSKERSNFMSDFMRAIVKRCSGELCGARKLYSDDNDVMEHPLTAKTIIPCFQGNHSKCIKSFVCCKCVRHRTHAKHLPNKKYLKSLTDLDKLLLSR